MEWINEEKTDSELIEGWVENLHNYLLRLLEANNGWLELPENMVKNNLLNAMGKDMLDLLQDIKNSQNKSTVS